MTPVLVCAFSSNLQGAWVQQLPEQITTVMLVRRQATNSAYLRLDIISLEMACCGLATFSALEVVGIVAFETRTSGESTTAWSGQTHAFSPFNMERVSRYVRIWVVNRPFCAGKTVFGAKLATDPKIGVSGGGVGHKVA